MDPVKPADSIGERFQSDLEISSRGRSRNAHRPGPASYGFGDEICVDAYRSNSVEKRRSCPWVYVKSEMEAAPQKRGLMRTTFLRLEILNLAKTRQICVNKS